MLSDTWSLPLCISGNFTGTRAGGGSTRLLDRDAQYHPFSNTTRVEYDDVIKWKHFPRYRSFVRGIPRSPVKSPHKGQWRGRLMFSFICAWINGWVNNRKAGDLKRHRAHYTLTKNKVDDLLDYDLKHQGPNKMATVLQITFSNIF